MEFCFDKIHFFRIIHHKEFSQDELKIMRSLVFANILETLKLICSHMPDYDLDFEDVDCEVFGCKFSAVEPFYSDHLCTAAKLSIVANEAFSYKWSNYVKTSLQRPLQMEFIAVATMERFRYTSKSNIHK